MSLQAPYKRDSDAQGILAHLLNLRAACARDPRTGEPLAQSLHEYLLAVHQELRKAKKPLPEDLLMVCVRLSLEAVRNVVGHPRYRLLRKRKLLPPHKADEVDTSSLMWLARQPGRNNREKLATRNRMMAVDREVSLNTAENRLLVRFIRYIEPLLSARLQERDTYDNSPESSARFAMVEELHELCSDILSGREMEDIEPSLVIQPNNAMLSDPNYNLIWRAFNLLRVEPQREPMADEAITRTLFLGILAMLVEEYGAQCCEQLVRADAGIGDEHMGLAVSALGGCSALCAATVLLPPSKGSNKCRGVVTEVIESPKATFGHICEEGHPKPIWFSPRCLAQGVEWAAIKRGTIVSYQKFEGDKGPVASGIMPAGPPIRALLLRQKASRLNLALCEWTHSGKAQTFQTSVDIGLKSNGTILASLSGKGKETRTCDLTFPGIMAAVEFVCGRGVGLIDAVNQGEQLCNRSQTAMGGVGIDVSGAAIECRVDGTHVLSCPELFGARYPALSPTLQACVKGYVYDPCADSAEYISLSSLWRSSSPMETRSATELARSFCEQLKAYLTLTDESRLAVAVPDDADDFTLRPLLDNLEISYPERVGVIRRSVAAGLAWQQSTGYAGADIRQGDVLLVVDAGGPSFCTTPLVARSNSRFENDPSRGILWERRPSHIPEDWELDLSYRSLLLEYAVAAVRFYGCDSLIPPDELASSLVDMGVIHLVLRERAPRFIPLDVRRGEAILEVQYIPDLWQNICTKWQSAMKSCLDEWRDPRGGLAELLYGVLDRSNRVTLLLCLPDAMRDAIGIEWKTRVGKSLPPNIPIHSACYMDNSDAQLAVGAHIAAQRLKKSLPVCIEWIPDLALDVTRSGLFDKLQILQMQAIEAKAGSSLEYEVEEPLTLEPGVSAYVFPLIQGAHTGYPRQFDARLESPDFPLDKEAIIRLSIAYKYGTNRYSLSAHSAEATGRQVRRLQFSFGHHQDALQNIEAPRFVTGGYMGKARRRAYATEMLRAIQDLERLCDALFGVSTPDRCDRYSRDLRHLLIRRLPTYMALTWRPRGEEDQDWIGTAKAAVPTLARLWGGTTEGTVDWPAAIDVTDRRQNQLSAMQLLCRMRTILPMSVAEAICTRSFDVVCDAPAEWSLSIRWLIGLPSGHGMKARSAAVDILKRCPQLDNGWEIESHALQALAFGMWDLPTSIFMLQESSPSGAVERICSRIHKKLDSAVIDGIADADRPFWGIWFGAACVFVLSVLRLHERDMLSSRLARLLRRSTRGIRLVDGMLAREDVKIVTPITLKLEKPRALRNVSDAAYAANLFIAGEDACRLVEVSEAVYESREEV